MVDTDVQNWINFREHQERQEHRKYQKHQKQIEKRRKERAKEKIKRYRQTNALYKTYYDRLKIYNDIIESPEGFLEVQCKYCNTWIIPTNTQVQTRLKSCESSNHGGECHFYCNDNCKRACPTYNSKLYPKGFRPATSREVEPELRKLVFKRDNLTCVKCGNTNQNSQLHCHHIEGAVQSPMTANDVDNCITVCKKCHEEIPCKPYC